jgi:beta-xylosidase
LVPVTWEDGWPVFNNHQPIAEVMPGLTNINRPKLWVDAFDHDGSNELNIGWYSVRTPYKTQYSLSARPGYLRIYGSFINLTEVASPAVYLRKQTDFNATWSTSLEYYPSTQDVGEAGTVLWLTEDYNQAIGVRRCDNDPENRCIVTRTNTGPNLTFTVSYRFRSICLCLASP